MTNTASSTQLQNTTEYVWPTHAQEFVCINKWQESPTSVSILLSQPQLPANQVFNYQAGQFVSLGLNIDGKTHYRAYSISNPPGSQTLQLTVKRVEKGLVSNAICDSLKVGDSVELLSPQGEFYLRANDLPKKLILISAGCGVTPVMAMLRQLISKQKVSAHGQAEGASDTPLEIHFIHAAQNRHEIIYHQELQAIAQENPNIHLHIMLEDATGTQYPQGRIQQGDLVRFCGYLDNSQVYLCGPVGFMESIEAQFTALNFDMSHFRQESFTPTQAAEQEGNSETENTNSTVQVAIPKFSKSVDAATGSVLLDALESAAVPVIAACRSGICGSCKCKVKGDIHRTSTATLTPEEIEQGYALACSSQIQGDLEVELG